MQMRENSEDCEENWLLMKVKISKSFGCLKERLGCLKQALNYKVSKISECGFEKHPSW